jgi:PTS system nitrogen regulatory IIA component
MSKENEMTDQWLTIDQIAEYLQVSKEKIYKLCQRGKMPAYKCVGQWRFKKQEIDKWIRLQRPKEK